MDRDFKGVWIPKEIWLCKELSALDRVIYAEIDSLDNENHCTASNEYFAEFCGVSEPTITRSIQKLIDKGYIEKVSFDGRHRILKVISQTNQNDYSESSKCATNNINNNIGSKKDKISKDITTEGCSNKNSLFDIIAEKPKRQKKKNMYENDIDVIMQYTNNIVLQEKLKEYLDLRLQIARSEGKNYFTNQWKGTLNELDKLTSDTSTMVKIVEQSIRNGWKGFYPLKDSSKSTVKSHPSEKNVDTVKRSDEELDLVDEVY